MSSKASEENHDRLDTFYSQFDNLTKEQQSAVYSQVVDDGLDANDPAVMTKVVDALAKGRSTSRGKAIAENDKYYMDYIDWKYRSPLLTRPDLSGRELHGVTFKKQAYPGADLGGAVLDGKDLSDVDLRGAYIVGADLSRADLHKANLREANLRNALLRGADLSSANLRGADLRGADLRDANIWGTKMESAYLVRADMEDLELKSDKMWSRWIMQNSGREGFQFDKAELAQLRDMYSHKAEGKPYAGPNPLTNSDIPLDSEDWLAEKGIMVRRYDGGRRFDDKLFRLDYQPPSGKLSYSGAKLDAHLFNVPADIKVFYMRGDKVFLTGEGVPDERKVDSLPGDFYSGTWDNVFQRDKGAIITLPSAPAPTSFGDVAVATGPTPDVQPQSTIEAVGAPGENIELVSADSSELDFLNVEARFNDPETASPDDPIVKLVQQSEDSDVLVDINENAMSIEPVATDSYERAESNSFRPEMSAFQGFKSQAPKARKTRQSPRHPFWSRKESKRR